MKIETLEVKRINPTLKKAFPIGDVKGLPRIVGPKRPMVALQAVTSEGIDAWSTVDALPFPFYNMEWTDGAFTLLQEVGARLVGVEVTSAEELVDALGPIVGHNMLKAGVANLFFDSQSLKQGCPLYKMVGGKGGKAEVGISMGKDSTTEDIQARISQGFGRIKIKVGPHTDDCSKVATIVRAFPNLRVMVDANSSFDHENRKHMKLLKGLGDLGLLMIEQPLAHDDIRNHVALQQEFNKHGIPGRICLDESIETMDQLKQAVEGGIPIINIKQARVGGLHIAREMIEICQEHGVDTWIGGMIEPTASKAHSLALATHPGVTLPADISGTSAYFIDDPVAEPMEVSATGKGSYICLPEKPGRGWENDPQKVAAITTQKIVFSAKK